MAFSGGTPLADWSGLVPTAPTEPIVAYQLRSPNESKNYLLRVTGMEVKYKRKGSDFSELQDGMLDHFEKYGLDSVAHLQNPLDTTKMTNIITQHPQYTMGKVTQLMTVQVTLYDKYDKGNDKAACDYMLDSLDNEFRCDLEDQSCELKTFPELFMILVQITTGDSMEHWETVKTMMRSLVPQKYSGKTITLLTKDFAAKARPLKAAGLYDHTLMGSDRMLTGRPSKDPILV